MNDSSTFPSLVMLATALFGIAIVGALIPLAAALAPGRKKDATSAIKEGAN
jgi:hypothetical protein